MQKKDIILFFTIIVFLSIFSSRNINYDDYIYIWGADKIIENSNINLANLKLPFLGNVHSAIEGTHSIFPAYFFAYILKIKYSLVFLHIIIYLIFASIYFPLYKIYYLWDNKFTYLKVLIIMSSPIVLLNVNNFMTDILGFVFFIYALYFFIYGENKKLFPMLSVLFFIIAFLFSYIYLYFLVLVFIFNLSGKRKKYKFFILISITTILFILLFYYLRMIPSILQAMKWLGSEKLFNYHKIVDKFIAYILLIGFVFFPGLFFNRENYSPMLLMSIFMSFIFTLQLCKCPVISTFIYFLLMGFGLYILYIMLKNTEKYKKLILWYSIFSILALIIFPMIIARYILVILLPLYIIINKDINRYSLLIIIIVNLIFSSILLYSDMKQTNSYYKINVMGDKVAFTGEWGFRKHIENNDGQMILKTDSILMDSTYILIPINEVKQEINKKILSHLFFINNQKYYNFPIKIYSSYSKCGFYTNETGLLPFSIDNEYTTDVNTYLYRVKGNKYMMQYEDSIVLWNNNVLIPLEVPGSIEFYNVKSVKLHLIFYPSSDVIKHSDGVKIIIENNGSEYKCIPKRENIIFIKDSFEIMKIRIDSFNNNLYDWIGIYAE